MKTQLLKKKVMVIFNLRYRNNLWDLRQSALSFSMTHHFTVSGLFTLLITGVTFFMTSIAFELVSQEALQMMSFP